MAFSLNQVQLIGRLGKDPEQSSDKAPVKASLATDRNYRDEKSDTGQPKDHLACIDRLGQGW